MLKNTLQVLGTITFIAALIFGYVLIAIRPAPNYNTIYTNQYKDELFTNDLIGTTEKELITLIGEPFTRDSLDKFHNYVVYQTNRAVAKNGGYSGTGDTGNHLILDIDENNIITRSDYYNGIEFKSDEYVGKEFNPSDYSFVGKKSNEVKCNCSCEILTYTKSKNSFFGKAPNIHDRIIVLKNNRVYKVIKKDYKNMDHLDQTLHKEVCEVNDVN